MSDKPNYRQERVERLLYELQHEVTRGMMEGELDEHLTFNFFVPRSKNIPKGVVHCRFETRPVPFYAMGPGDTQPRLKVVK